MLENLTLNPPEEAVSRETQQRAIKDMLGDIAVKAGTTVSELKPTITRANLGKLKEIFEKK